MIKYKEGLWMCADCTYKVRIEGDKPDHFYCEEVERKGLLKDGHITGDTDAIECVRNGVYKNKPGTPSPYIKNEQEGI